MITPEQKQRYKRQQKVYNKTYLRRPEVRLRRSQQGASRHQKNKEVFAALKAKPCADCGLRYPPYVMDFDHVRGKKDKCVSKMRVTNLDRILKEIAKCDLVCANCHRERTQKRFPSPGD